MYELDMSYKAYWIRFIEYWMSSTDSIDKVLQEFNASWPVPNSPIIVFETEEDATVFILKWS